MGVWGWEDRVILEKCISLLEEERGSVMASVEPESEGVTEFVSEFTDKFKREAGIAACVDREWGEVDMGCTCRKTLVVVSFSLIVKMKKQR